MEAKTAAGTEEKGVFHPKIMVVEDNRIARLAIQNEIGTIEGATVVVVTDGAEVLNTAQAEKPDLITLPSECPGVSGVEICRRLKNSPATRNIPIIFIAQDDKWDSQKEAFAAGAAEYIVAPFPKGKLAKKAQRFLGGNTEDLPSIPQTILVAEDSDTIRNVVSGILKKQGHTVVEARDGMIAWTILQKRRDIDLIISDINMPNLDGRQLCNLVRGLDDYAFVPIIVISTITEKEDIADILNSGADDYVIKPFATEEFLARLRAHIRVRHLYSELNSANSRLQTFNISLEKMVDYRTKELNEANLESIMMLAVASEYRDVDTGNHVRRIAEFTKSIALGVNYPEKKAEAISNASILHDVGKIAINDLILRKEGKLTAEEFIVMKTHTLAGEAILSKTPFFKMAREVARSHHERFDGSGYPDGLREYNIPLAARITAVADVFDALTSKRVYKPAWKMEDAHEYILAQSGKHFDPMVVEAFDKVYKDGLVAHLIEKYK